MDHITTKGGTVTVTRAAHRDVPEIVALLRDDDIGAGREGADLTVYETAFFHVDADPNQLLVIARDERDRPVGTMQLTFVPGLSRGGALRMHVEGVRIASSARGIGLGSALFAWAHAQGRARGAALAQLTSDKRRADAHRFYEQLGYERTHEGFKLQLDGAGRADLT